MVICPSIRSWYPAIQSTKKVRSAKADVIAMEARIREIEKELKDLTGDELESRLNTYHNLTRPLNWQTDTPMKARLSVY